MMSVSSVLKVVRVALGIPAWFQELRSKARVTSVALNDRGRSNLGTCAPQSVLCQFKRQLLISSRSAGFQLTFEKIRTSSSFHIERINAGPYEGGSLPSFISFKGFECQASPDFSLSRAPRTRHPCAKSRIDLIQGGRSTYAAAFSASSYRVGGSPFSRVRVKADAR